MLWLSACKSQKSLSNAKAITAGYYQKVMLVFTWSACCFSPMLNKPEYAGNVSANPTYKISQQSVKSPFSNILKHLQMPPWGRNDAVPATQHNSSSWWYMATQLHRYYSVVVLGVAEHTTVSLNVTPCRNLTRNPNLGKQWQAGKSWPWRQLNCC
jgi:hypothetical protein